MRKTMTSLLAGIGLVLACGTSVYAQDKSLTIFWAEWDPANYLQELGNEYEKETGVKITVETTPWPDFQTKAFTEFNAHGDAGFLLVLVAQLLQVVGRIPFGPQDGQFLSEHVRARGKH